MNRHQAKKFGPSNMPCPNCQTPLEFTLDKLFSGSTIKCANCHCEMSADVGQSRDALMALDKADKLLRQAQRRQR